MDIKDLISASSNAEQIIINALTEYVREHGDEMSDYYYNEFGLYEEDEDEVKIVKVLDTSMTGCFFAKQFEVNDDSLKDIDRNGYGYEIFDKLHNSFGYATYWAFYIVNENGNERLKYYQFFNDGVCYEEDSEPDHDYVDTLSLAELHYIIEAIVKENKRSY